jgi:hypothetical protein
MSYQRLFEGKISQSDQGTKTIAVTQEEAYGKKSHPVNLSFALDPDIVITNRNRGTFGFKHLKMGQKVVVFYVTKPIDKRIAKTIVVVEPLVWP